MRYPPHWIIPIVLLCLAHGLSAQTWVPVDPENIMISGKRDILPQECVTYHMDHQNMKTMLWGAPYEYAQQPSNSNTVIMVGLANGTMDMFRMVQYDMMEAPLAAQYTEIKTFRGVSISNPYRTIRADWSVNGFRAVISDLEGKTYIDPYQRNDMAHRIVYHKNKYTRAIDWACGLEGVSLQGENILQNRVVGDCEFRSYRLAVATAGEYSNYFGANSSAQSALVLAQVVTAVNRVNDVYEADFSTRLILIANTDAVFYYDVGSDPYSGDACNQLGQNQTTIDAVIGSANYDIGHVFGVGSGGCAGLGVICSNSNKARGATGLDPPTGDPFYIDYVAHELGHQFGANHTQNNGCNRNNATALEPGSASTIMGYAGICNPNVQSNSDPYMHAVSLVEIANKIGSTSCEAIISTSNSAPVVADFPNYTIPKSTPFVLTASATDADNDPLTYCWEQWDHEVGTMPPQPTNTVGPMFRSLLPTSSPSRYFPNLPAIIAGTTPTWEVLPSVGRSMEFRVTVRDLHDGMFGCTDEDNTIITTTAVAGPFIVSSQNTPTTWYEGAIETITWNVANTTASPVNCANVDIMLSLDGGLTYPTLLLQNTPNDGSATVTIPAGVTTAGRVMVKASDNIFFDINNAHITIEQALPNFILSLDPAELSECNDGSVQTTVNVGQFLGFSDPVTLTVINKPPGSTVSFVPSVVLPGSTSTLTISNLTGLVGTYTPTVRGSSTTGNQDKVFTINLLAPPTTSPTLVSPANNTTDAVITPVLDWQSVAGSTLYVYELAYDNMFSNIVSSGATPLDQFHITSPLIVGQQYFWRVRSDNSCGPGVWSSAFTFTTSSCFALMSSDVPVQIPVGATVVASVFDCPIDMLINDVNVINLTGNHSWVDDLKFSLIAPDGTERLIWDMPCGNHDNFNINFDDEAANSNWPCPPTDGLTYKPNNTLSFFDGKQSGGEWILEIEDVYPQADGGSLISWGLKVCGDLGCQLTVNQPVGSGTGSLPSAIACAAVGDTIRIASLLAGQTIDIGSAPMLLDKNLVILAESSGINITGSGTRVFETVVGVEVGFIGLQITAGTAMDGAAINNPGTLRLTDVTIEANAGVNGATLIQNMAGGQLFVYGNCNLHQ